MMSNGDEYYSQGNHGGNYSNTYSLWGNSAFYDINNLSPQNYFSNARSTAKDEDYKASRCDMELWAGRGATVEDQDSRNRRIIKKETLFEYPSSFRKHQHEPSNSSLCADTYWSEQWLQREGPGGGGAPTPRSCRQLLKRENRVHEDLTEPAAHPIKMTKAESMMQKMGWQGGALGKTGEGIVEPIMPSFIYTTKIGLGAHEVRQPSTSRMAVQQQKKQKLETREIFDTNVLLQILEFVKNNNEVELLFDKQLTRMERKRVHNLVNDVLSADDLSLAKYTSVAVMNLALQISDHNCFILITQSEGEQLDRTLCLYKLPPPHVYLIIPEDLREETEIPADAEEITQVDPDEDSNPFLRSITRNLKNCNTQEQRRRCDDKCHHQRDSLNKILDFFREFAQKDEFTAFRYLGPFEQEECDSFALFLSLATRHLQGDTLCDKYRAVFQKIKYNINADINGHPVIYKGMGTDEKS